MTHHEKYLFFKKNWANLWIVALKQHRVVKVLFFKEQFQFLVLFSEIYNNTSVSLLPNVDNSTLKYGDIFVLKGFRKERDMMLVIERIIFYECKRKQLQVVNRGTL